MSAHETHRAVFSEKLDEDKRVADTLRELLVGNPILIEEIRKGPHLSRRSLITLSSSRVTYYVYGWADKQEGGVMVVAYRWHSKGGHNLDNRGYLFTMGVPYSPAPEPKKKRTSRRPRKK